MLRLAALVPFTLVACVSGGDEGMYILNNTATTESCALNGSPDQPQRGHGLIHYQSPTAYVMTPLIQSRLQSAEGGDVTSKTIQLRGADVTLTLKAYSVESGGSFRSENPNTMLGAPFTVLFSGSLPPSGFVNTFIDLIPPAQLRMVAAATGANVNADVFNAEVLASVVVRGEVGDDSIDTEPFLYPVTVCNDCVVVNLGACPQAAVRLGNACNPFQDGMVDCCKDADGKLVCPASP